MPAKENSVEDHAKDAIDEEVKFDRVPAIACLQVEGEEDKRRNDVPEVRDSPANERNDEDLDDEVQRLDESEQEDENCLCIDGVLWPSSKEVPNWFEGSCLVVQLSIGTHMMADAVHHLPLIVREASYSEAVLEHICLVVNKVVPDAHHRDQEHRGDGSEHERQPGLFVLINGVSRQSQKQN